MLPIGQALKAALRTTFETLGMRIADLADRLGMKDCHRAARVIAPKRPSKLHRLAALDALGWKVEIVVVSQGPAIADFPPFRQSKPEIVDRGTVRLGDACITAEFPSFPQPTREPPKSYPSPTYGCGSAAGGMTAPRRLAAILAADVAEYSRLMELDEVATAQALREHRAAADPLIAEHGGRIVNTTGDGLLIEFGSVVSAVECALALQYLAAERNAAAASDRRMEWRIGVNHGDVLIEGESILGNAINIAARLERIAEAGGVCISEDTFRQVRSKVKAEFVDLGEQRLKNIARPLRVYSVGSLPTARRPFQGAR